MSELRRLIAGVALLLLGIVCVAKAQEDTVIGSGVTGMFKHVATYTGPGDVVSGAFYWWGLRAYSAAKAGTKAANVCNATPVCADINTLANGNFDVATATGGTLACGGAGGTCTVKTLYDQSGSNSCSGPCDATNATTAQQPTLSFNCLNATLPCMVFNTSTNLTAPAFSATMTSPYTYSIVWASGSDGGSGGVMGFTDVQNEIGNDLTTTGTIGIKGNGGTTFEVAAVVTSWHAVQMTFVSSSATAAYVDGTSTTGGAIDATLSSGAPKYASTKFSAQWFQSGAEGGFWLQDFSASSFAKASAMCHNQFKYWATVTSC